VSSFNSYAREERIRKQYYRARELGVLDKAVEIAHIVHLASPDDDRLSIASRVEEAVVDLILSYEDKDDR
jgi:hypothetical protein